MKLIPMTCLFIALSSSPVFASYDANISGIVVDVITYASGNLYFRLSNQPTTHNGCGPTYFSIDTALAADVRARMLSRLLTAQTTGQTISIGYAATGDCAQGYIRTYKVG